jgi:hypothetical protein
VQTAQLIACRVLKQRNWSKCEHSGRRGVIRMELGRDAGGAKLSPDARLPAG